MPVVKYLQSLEELAFEKPVTFFVGENGTGKSTLLEAIAVALGFNPEGGSRDFSFSTKSSHSVLHQYLTTIKSGYPKDGFFLRAESFYNTATYLDVHNHLIFNAVDFVDYHAYKSYKRIYYDMREVSDRLCKENGLSVIPPSQNKGMGYKEYTEAKRGTSWKQKLKQTIDRLVITAKDYDDFLRLMQEAGYEIKTGKYISFRAEGQERFTRSKTIGENYTEERIKERIAGRTPRRSQRQTTPKGISLIGDIQERIRLIDSNCLSSERRYTERSTGTPGYYGCLTGSCSLLPERTLCGCYSA